MEVAQNMATVNTTVDIVQRLVDVLRIDPEEKSAYLKTFMSGVKPSVSLDYNTDADSFRDRYLLSELLSKYNAFPAKDGIAPSEVALAEFYEQESLNLQTNKRLRADPLNPTISSVLDKASRLVRLVVGRDITSKIPYILESGYFGPGLSQGYRFDKSAHDDKLLGKLTCTSELAPYALSIVNSNSTWSTAQVRRKMLSESKDDLFYPVGKILLPSGRCSALSLDIDECNARVTTVPKNASTDRVITVEPIVNSYLQGGIMRYIRQRLLRVGQDIRDQKRNQQYAKCGSQYKYATIDLKQASNSLTVQLVYKLCSRVRGLYELLDLARSKRYGEGTCFQLFSGMGNNTTFPCQTLIYWALCTAWLLEAGVKADVSVYGDDIIFPCGEVDSLIDFFKYVGLTINVKKTHYKTEFRESCGAHFYKGTPVQPLYIRRPIQALQDGITVHNAIWRWACQDGMSFDARVIPVLRFIRSTFPASFVHPDLGDVGYFPLRTIGHPDRLYRQRLWVSKTRERRLRSGVHALLIFDRAIEQVRKGKSLPGIYDRSRAGLTPFREVETYGENPGMITPRSKGEEYVWKRLYYSGYTFPYVYI